MGQGSFVQCAAAAVAAGLAAGAVLIATVLASGQTFGQRCSADYTTGSDAWKRCVADLGKGRQ